MSVTKTRSAYLNRIQTNRECFLGFEFHLLAMGIYPRLIKCVWKGPPEASENELNTSDGCFPNSFLRTSRGRNSPHSQHNRFQNLTTFIFSTEYDSESFTIHGYCPQEKMDT